MQTYYLTKETRPTSCWSGGTTTELFIYPENSEYKKRDFLFRLSTASVDTETSGFTLLPKIRRILMVLEQDIRLQIDGTFHALSPYEQISFSGDTPVKSYGTCRDFNLMMNGNCRGHLYGISSSAPGFQSFSNPFPEDSSVFFVFYPPESDCTLEINGQLFFIKNRILWYSARRNQMRYKRLSDTPEALSAPVSRFLPSIHERKLMNTIQSLITSIGTPGRNPDGSYSRLPYSDAYYEALNILKKRMEDLDMTVSTDAAGNIHGVYSGMDNSLPAIMIGSHLDTVRNGGLFDGPLGIASALQCIEYLRDNNIRLSHPVEVWGFHAEEGSDLGGTFGSRSIMGLVDYTTPQMQEALNRYQISADDLKRCRIDPAHKLCFMEVHIEQGLNLIKNNLSIGIVTGIVGITRYDITVYGKASHAGTTAMGERMDSLVCASCLISFIHEEAGKIPDFVATVGQIDNYPNAVAVIPGKTHMILEMRHLNQDVIQKFLETVKRYACSLGSYRIEFTLNVEKHATNCSPILMEGLQTVCHNLSYPCTRLPSGAGHDGNAIGTKIPVAMLFVPSKDGLSHCKEEWTDWEQAQKGADVLREAVIWVDKIDEGILDL